MIHAHASLELLCPIVHTHTQYVHAFFLFFRIRYPPFTDKNVQTGKWLLVPKIKNESSYFTYIILLACIVVAVISLVLQVSE